MISEQPPERIWVTTPVEFNSLISKAGPAFENDVAYVPADLLDAARAEARREAWDAMKIILFSTDYPNYEGLSQDACDALESYDNALAAALSAARKD